MPRGGLQTSRWAGVDECTRPNIFRNGQLANPVGAANGLGAPWTGCWQLAPKGDSSGTWIESYRAGGGNGQPRGQRPHAGAHRESPGRAGRPCAAVRCAPGSPRSSPASTDSTHKPPPSVSTGHSVASTNRHRIPAGVESDAGGWQTAGASAVSQSDPWYFSAVREPAGPAGSPSDQAVGEQQDRHPSDGGEPGG